MTCENCGIPEGTLITPGRSVTIKRPAENNFVRERTSNVWVCSDECGVQALAVSKYGPASHKWPITLAQFRAMNPFRETVKVKRGVRPSKIAKLRLAESMG